MTKKVLGDGEGSYGLEWRLSNNERRDAASWGIAGVDFDVVHYGLASTPAMFNSTLTKNEDILCPVDGAIMITGLRVAWEKMFWLLLQWLKPPSDGNLLKGRLWISVWFMQLTVLGLLTYYTRLHKSSLLDLRVSRLIVVF
ncbi:putative alpha-D-phosphohexomutase, alpha/beta/alpha I/II/III [Helianthus debilis subsp. tardiflorus]